MRKHQVFGIFALLFPFLLQAELHLEDGVYAFTSGRLSISIDAEIGSCVGVGLGGEAIMGSPSISPMPVCLKHGERWLPAELNDSRLTKVEELSPTEVAVSFAFDDWLVKQSYRLYSGKGRIRRLMGVT